MHRHLRVLVVLCCSSALSDYQMQLADDDVRLPGPDPAAGDMLQTYLGAIWARYTTHGHCYAYIKQLITRSQIAHYL